MADESYKRKLAAILSADVEGYSRLMDDDEEATVRTLTVYRNAINDLVQQYRGRIVDTPGDNILAEFTSVVDAVSCGVKIQRELAERNKDLPDERKMQFRIGVNLGDVIDEEERIYGDGVNIAARIESLSEAGGICISHSAYDQIKNKLKFGYEYLGEHEVKNIREPIKAYRILIAPEFEGKFIGFDKKPSKRGLVWAAAAAVVVAVVGLGIWQFYGRRLAIEAASEKKMVYPLPDKPSIAVLPFDNMSEDPGQGYFCDGLTEEIITALSKVPQIFVIARNSVFTYKGKPVKVKQVAEDLGVQYVLEGSVRKAGDKIRITAQLIDALSGHHLWAERYDRNLEEIFAIQDDLTKNIIAGMQVQLTEGEQARAAARGTNNLEAYLKYLQANEYILRLNIESNALGKQLADEAIALDPEYAMAYRALAGAHMMDVWLGTSKFPKQSQAKAKELLQKALALDDSLAEAHDLLAFLCSMKKQYDESIAEAEKAVALNPNSAQCRYRMGKVLSFAGKWKESLPEYKKAIRLNPIPPNMYLWSLGLSYAMTGQNEEAITWGEKAIRQEPDSLLAHLIMAAIYVFSGRDEEARVEAAEVLRINPKFSLDKFAKRASYKKKADNELMIGAWRKAGLPD